jgi:hypothetical protein
MAQPPNRTGIPPAPPPLDPRTGQPPPAQVNIHGQPPAPNMAPPESPPEGLGDNTRAEMEAGRKNLSQYRRRDDAEHEAGRAALSQRVGNVNRPQE